MQCNKNIHLNNEKNNCNDHVLYGQRVNGLVISYLKPNIIKKYSKFLWTSYFTINF